MSGWIKLEKDLLTDPRVLRIGKKLCNANALQGVTLALGALAHLWILADTHVRNDDVLPLGADDINKLIGLEGFCEILPSDWLEILDAENVKLPGFHAHNGTQAKKKALTAKRVGRHRLQRNAQALQVSNGHALPDQDQDQDQDQDHTKTKNRKGDSAARSTRIPPNFDLNPERWKYAETQGLNPVFTMEAFKDYWTAASGAKARKNDWDACWRTWCRNQYGKAGKVETKPRKTRYEELVGPLEAAINGER